jgi:hypothetical protein
MWKCWRGRLCAKWRALLAQLRLWLTKTIWIWSRKSRRGKFRVNWWSILSIYFHCNSARSFRPERSDRFVIFFYVVASKFILFLPIINIGIKLSGE